MLNEAKGVNKLAAVVSQLVMHYAYERWPLSLSASLPFAVSTNTMPMGDHNEATKLLL
jgi:hypothetical protein